MNPNDQSKFDAIMLKDADGLTSEEIALLKKNEGVMTPAQKQKFAKVLA